MKLMAMVMVTDMTASVTFYESLGLVRKESGEVNPYWNEFAIGDARLALHYASVDEIQPASRQLQLNLDLPTGGALDALRDSCLALGLELGGDISEQGFGRFFWIRDPDGLPIQFNESGA